MSKGICIVEGCERQQRHHVYDYCVNHLRRLKLYGDPTAAPPPRPHKPKPECSVDGCDQERFCRGLCTMRTINGYVNTARWKPLYGKQDLNIAILRSIETLEHR